MAALLIETKDKSELKLLRDMLKRMRIRSKLLSPQEAEDAAFGTLVEKADRSKKVSRERIMKKLALQ